MGVDSGCSTDQTLLTESKASTVVTEVLGVCPPEKMRQNRQQSEKRTCEECPVPDRGGVLVEEGLAEPIAIGPGHGRRVQNVADNTEQKHA